LPETVLVARPEPGMGSQSQAFTGFCSGALTGVTAAWVKRSTGLDCFPFPAQVRIDVENAALTFRGTPFASASAKRHPKGQNAPEPLKRAKIKIAHHFSNLS